MRNELSDCSAFEKSDATKVNDYKGDFCSDTLPTPKNYWCQDPPGYDQCTAGPNNAWAVHNDGGAGQPPNRSTPYRNFVRAPVVCVSVCNGVCDVVAVCFSFVCGRCPMHPTSADASGLSNRCDVFDATLPAL